MSAAVSVGCNVDVGELLLNLNYHT